MRHLKKGAMQFIQGLKGWWLLPPALCLLLLQPVDLRICHFLLYRYHLRPPRSWPPPGPAAAAGWCPGLTRPRRSYPWADRSALPFPGSLRRYQDTGDDPVKEETREPGMSVNFLFPSPLYPILIFIYFYTGARPPVREKAKVAIKPLVAAEVTVPQQKLTVLL